MCGTIQTAKLIGNEDLARHTTSDGTEWCLSSGGRFAWPLYGPATALGTFDTTVARALGQEVDRRVKRDDYTVTNAAPGWREMYEWLRAQAPKRKKKKKRKKGKAP